MSGYREHSYDPAAYEQPGPPMRPFNWVQWTGVALAAAGLAIDGLYFTGRLGWTGVRPANPMLALGLMLPGIVLINSRRQPATDLAPELAAARKRWLIIVTILCAVVLGAAAIIDLQGAF